MALSHTRLEYTLHMKGREEETEREGEWEKERLVSKQVKHITIYTGRMAY